MHSEMSTGPQRAKRRRNGQGNWRLVRYADDFVLMVFGERCHAEALREEVSAVARPPGLRLAPEKTRVVHVDEGFTFLGFDIRRMRKRGTSKYYVYTKPSRKAIRVDQDKVKAKTYRFNPPHGPRRADPQPEQVTGRVGELLPARLVQGNLQRGRLLRMGSADALDTRQVRGQDRLSMKELRRRFCDQGWRFAHNGVVLTGASSVAVTRYRYRAAPYRPRGPRTGSSLPRRLTSGQDTWSARCAETWHVGCGERVGETDWPQGQHRAPARLNRRCASRPGALLAELSLEQGISAAMAPCTTR